MRYLKQQFRGVDAVIFLSIGAWDIPISVQLYPHIARKLPIQINYEEQIDFFVFKQEHVGVLNSEKLHGLVNMSSSDMFCQFRFIHTCAFYRVIVSHTSSVNN